MATLLVADDHPDAVELLAIYFRLAGYTVVTAQDGLEAVAAVRKHAPDVVLMDLWMPGLGGVAATKQIHAFPEHAHLPVIAYTANAKSLKGDRHLFSAVCEKPIRPSEVVQVVADVLGRPDRAK